MKKDFNAVTSALKFSICSILKSSWLLENTRDLFGNDEACVEGFSGELVLQQFVRNNFYDSMVCLL